MTKLNMLSYALYLIIIEFMLTFLY